MALSDLVLKAKVNMALMRDPRIRAHDVRVQVENGCATLTGDVDDQEHCRVAEEIARGVVGITSVRNQMTCGLHIRATTVELLTLRLLEELDETWFGLPDNHALTQADYLRWALWMIYKFRIPPELVEGKSAEIEAEVVDEALTRIAGFVSAPKALVALEMLHQAELIPPGREEGRGKREE
jgi:hypothetical protein